MTLECKQQAHRLCKEVKRVLSDSGNMLRTHFFKVCHMYTFENTKILICVPYVKRNLFANFLRATALPHEISIGILARFGWRYFQNPPQ